MWRKVISISAVVWAMVGCGGLETERSTPNDGKGETTTQLRESVRCTAGAIVVTDAAERLVVHIDCNGDSCRQGVNAALCEKMKTYCDYKTLINTYTATRQYVAPGGTLPSVHPQIETDCSAGQPGGRCVTDGENAGCY